MNTTVNSTNDKTGKTFVLHGFFSTKYISYICTYKYPKIEFEKLMIYVSIVKTEKGYWKAKLIKKNNVKINAGIRCVN